MRRHAANLSMVSLLNARQAWNKTEWKMISGKCLKKVIGIFLRILSLKQVNFDFSPLQRR